VSMVWWAVLVRILLLAVVGWVLYGERRNGPAEFGPTMNEEKYDLLRAQTELQAVEIQGRPLITLTSGIIAAVAVFLGKSFPTPFVGTVLSLSVGALFVSLIFVVLAQSGIVTSVLVKIGRLRPIPRMVDFSNALYQWALGLFIIGIGLLAFFVIYSLQVGPPSP